jgi:thiamine biosynthesis lipoprotein
MGGKPDGSPWRIGIRDPKGDGLLGTVDLRDGAVITSGGYERYFTDEAGDLWWHIMDPKTGMPARRGLISVTVLGDRGLVCDALSTALFVMGEEKALAYWRAHREVELALVTEDGRLILTPGLAAGFTPAGNLAYTMEAADEEAKERREVWKRKGSKVIILRPSGPPPCRFSGSSGPPAGPPPGRRRR